MKLFATRGVERRKCPLCVGSIEISYLYQYSHDYKLTKSGRISKRYTTHDCGSMEVAVAMCECGANWNADEFEVTNDGRFVDYKYREAGE